MLGAVVLVVTGGEALYADMGHFGRRPIRLAWFRMVLPALLLNYFGQGALLLARSGGGRATRSIRLAPRVAAATRWSCSRPCATVIASQALISGAFSLTQQAVQLGYCRACRSCTPPPTTEGQIYVPAVNWALMVACIALVLGFGSSTQPGGARTASRSPATMVITTVLFYVYLVQLAAGPGRRPGRSAPGS